MDFSKLPNINHSKSDQFFLLAGPCAIEGEEMAFEIAEKVLEITDRFKIPFIFKGSFKKANRSRIDSFTGIGDETALEILQKIGKTFNIPTVTDIHEVADAQKAAAYVDVLQIPAFLVRQTDLVVAAAKTGKVVNLKKGQFTWITDRGTQFGYTDLIVDFRGVPAMRSLAPTILDVTHSLQQPNQASGVTGGRPELIETIARAGIVNHMDGLFIETHPKPSIAKSDGANMLSLDLLEGMLGRLTEIRKTINQF
jgi:2-dehydro-3-deoxyphosphooctonate aldolase (KDO 8-P synthase)